MSPKAAVPHRDHARVYESVRAFPAWTQSGLWRGGSGTALVLAVVLAGCAPPAAHGDGSGEIGASARVDAPSTEPPQTWNELVLSLARAEDGLLTLKGLRTVTMMHLAAHDALNAIRPRFAGYAYEGHAREANPIAAVAQASYEVAASQFDRPGQKQKLEAERDEQLRMLRDEVAKRQGIALGQAAAAAILAERKGDGWNTEVQYQWQPMGPGVYAEFREHSGTPEGFVFGAAWGKARPFALDGPGPLRAAPPPDIGSAEYARAFVEVKDLGRDESTSRTTDQTHLALWWKDFCESSLNRLGRQISAREGLDLWQTTRFFALLNMSLYDGYVTVFENKLHYNHWRPYTAIRWAANDGNPDTLPDPDWDNTHHHTYAFPSYPSAHGTACAAMFTVYEHVFGDGYAFTMTTEEVNESGPFSPMMKLNPPTRSFKSFDEAAMECAMSRVYLGIHFRYDSLAGNELGRKIGEHVVARHLTPKGAD